MPQGETRQSLAFWLALCGVVLAAAAIILLAMGRAPYCACGYVRLWQGEVMSSENSQHIADWYSPSHLIHGMLFYGALAWLARFVPALRPLGPRLLLATLIEAAWEIAENTETVIQRYREATIALGYDGDAVLNSVVDILFMGLGFALARKLPIWLTVALAVALELGVGYMIRDNLALNVLMLLFPQDAVRRWQSGG